jgi:hypothetical protein
MARSYVYRCKNKIDGRFYIGYRKANTMAARFDLGTYYFTSCPEVSNNFNDYTYEILGEFNYPETAFEIEQKLIFESRNSPLLINQAWKTTGLISNPLDDIKVYTSYKICEDAINGGIKLKRKSKKSRKIHIPTEQERLGMSGTQWLERREKRRERRRKKNLTKTVI